VAEPPPVASVREGNLHLHKNNNRKDWILHRKTAELAIMTLSMIPKVSDFISLLSLLFLFSPISNIFTPAYVSRSEAP
jgi:hypothetical protein